MFLNSDSEIETRTPAGTDLRIRKQWVAAQSIPAVLWIRIEANADPDPAIKVNAYTNPVRDPGFWCPKI